MCGIHSGIGLDSQFNSWSREMVLVIRCVFRKAWSLCSDFQPHNENNHEWKQVEKLTALPDSHKPIQHSTTSVTNVR